MVPFKNDLPGFIWVFAIPINKFFLNTLEGIKHKFLRYKLRKVLKDSARFGAMHTFSSSSIIADMMSQAFEAVTYAAIACWTVFGFPFVVHGNVESKWEKSDGC